MADDNKMDLTPKCAAGVDMKRRIAHVENDTKDQWKAIADLRNRLPVWATFMFTILGGALGSVITALIAT